MSPSLLLPILVFGSIAGGLEAQAKRAFSVEDALAIQNVSQARVSPDGKFVVYVVSGIDLEKDSSRSNLYQVPFGGGEAAALTSSDKTNTHPRFSPDGRFLAFLSDREDEKSQIYLFDRRGGEPKKLSSLPGGVSDFEWAPGGDRMVVVSKDPDPNEEKNDKEDDAEKEAKTKPPLVITRLQFKRDGVGYLDERRSHLYSLDVSSGEHRQLTDGPYDDSDPVFSPDGREIAFTSNRTEEPDANDNSDVFLVPSSGGAPRRLTSNPGADRAPVFSPDGKWIAYLSVTEPEIIWYALDQLAVVPADGGTPKVLTASLDRNVRALQFTSDGKHVLFLVEDQGNQHLARIPLEGGAVERVVTGERELMEFHEASNSIALVLSEPSLPPEVFAASAAAGEPPRRLSHTNDALLSQVALGAVDRIRFSSKDGTSVDGFVTKPAGFAAGRKYPTILWNHGGPVSQFSTAFNREWQVFAGAGYVVVSANPRGSSGYGRDFSHALWADWGHLDFEDVMAAVDHVISLGYADPARLGVGGWSYGGILTDYVITQSDRFRAATSGASETNFLACYGIDHYQHAWEKELGLPWENRDLYLRLSPLIRVASIVTPTLVLGGEHDWNVPLSQGEELYQSLRRRGVETTLIIYPGQGHSIRKPSYQKDRYERYLAWFGRFLGGRELAKQTDRGRGRRQAARELTPNQTLTE
jgi:dipeptidyl aminopeptidase/acylaminoacyl peptidase